jgi:hypothetical protein
MQRPRSSGIRRKGQLLRHDPEAAVKNEVPQPELADT